MKNVNAWSKDKIKIRYPSIASKDVSNDTARLACTRYFGFECKEDITNIPALQPELRDSAAFYTSLVNGGIISPNEAREALGYELREEAEDIRVPANIAGSASNPSEGGRPEEPQEEQEEWQQEKDVYRKM